MPEIVHLGVGNFHRAHQAWYTQKANAVSKEQWAITGVSLQRPTMRDALEAQGFDYTLAIKSSKKCQYEDVYVLRDILVAVENPENVIAKIADSNISLVTLTVTEKGYHTGRSGNQLDLDSPDIAEELQSGVPKTSIGFLSHGLKRRFENGAAPMTIISCDNLPENGRLLNTLVQEFCLHAGFEITNYLDEAVTFPITMVDRIVPATNQSLIDEVKRETGNSDNCPVSTEEYSEWVIENKFATSRPLWENVGVTIVDDVLPYELRKLRLLNGAHSYLAYAGQLAGHTYVHEAIRDTQLRAKVEWFWKEAIATLPLGAQAEAPDYCRALIDRFENPNLHHELAQIANDGSVKLPARILPLIFSHDEIDTGSTAFDAIAAWLAFVLRQLETEEEFNDPIEPDVRKLFEETLSMEAVAAFVIPNLSDRLPVNKVLALARRNFA